MVSNAFSIAWHAAENPQEKRHRVNQAARELARAIAVLVRLILQGILAYVLKNAGMATARAGLSTVRSATTAGVSATAETSVAEVAGLIRKSKLPDEFALWLETNWDDLTRNPKLKRKTVSQTIKNESGPTTTPSQLKEERDRLSQLAGKESNSTAGNDVARKSELTADQDGTVKPKAYSNPKNRPPYKDGQVDKVWENAKQPDGNVYDPNTGEKLEWDRNKSRAGQWDMGHLPGKEYRKLHKDYMDGKITKDEFLKEYQNPNNYSPESPSANRSHEFEE
ncbi:HNH/ENDO VII family nuclease [Methylomonas sp. EbA]|uniref:HNH/ENDO VII family nuclease n=2 Tax=Methylomonas albis TaxID=1854563 RepID=A0ABR9CUP6_9GAMM|nr:HNH/ENDO VII family nuclease [Methylomonas albis]